MKLALSQSGLSCGAASRHAIDDKAGVIDDAVRGKAEKQDADEQENQPERDEKKIFPDRFKRFLRAIEIHQRHEAERRQFHDDPQQGVLLDDEHERVREQVEIERRVKQTLGAVIFRPLHPPQEARRIKHHEHERMREDREKERAERIDPQPPIRRETD